MNHIDNKNYTEKINKSFSITKMNYINDMKKKEKISKNRSYNSYSNDSHLTLLSKCISNRCNKDEFINNYIDSCFNSS